MHDFTELDRSIDLDKPEKYHLSIQLMQDGFSFSIIESYIKRYVGTRHYQLKSGLYFDDYLDKISKILQNDDLLKREYNMVSLMNVSEKATLIPEQLFKKEDIKVVFDLNEELNDLEELHDNYVPGFDLYNVFAVHHELLNLFRDKYSNLNIYHHWTSLLCSSGLSETDNGVTILINFNSNSFDLIIVNDKKLLLCNSYKTESENDFVFYVLNTIKRLNLDKNNCNIEIIGNTHNKSKYFELLGLYISNFEIGDVCDDFSYSPSLKNVSKPLFYNLYNLYRCVLLEENTRV